MNTLGEQDKRAFPVSGKYYHSCTDDEASGGPSLSRCQTHRRGKQKVQTGVQVCLQRTLPWSAARVCLAPESSAGIGGEVWALAKWQQPRRADKNTNERAANGRCSDVPTLDTTVSLMRYMLCKPAKVTPKTQKNSSTLMNYFVHCLSPANLEGALIRRIEISWYDCIIGISLFCLCNDSYVMKSTFQNPFLDEWPPSIMPRWKRSSQHQVDGLNRSAILQHPEIWFLF